MGKTTTSHFYWRGPAHLAFASSEEMLASALGQRERVVLVSTSSVLAHPALGALLKRWLGPRLRATLPTIREHAPLEDLAHAVGEAQQVKADAVVALGGGSAIDAAKLILFALASGRDPLSADFADDAAAVTFDSKPLFVAIPTTLSTAELAPSAGFTTLATSALGRRKSGLMHPRLVPDVVIYDADLARSTPINLWLSTGVRALDHAIETLVADGEHPLSDATALDALPRLFGALAASQSAPQSAAARQDGQVGAVLAYTLPLEAARGLSHSLGKRIGASYGVPHGITSCVLLPSVVRLYEQRPALAPILARARLALGGSEVLSQALARLIATLGLPNRFSASQVSAEAVVAIERDFHHPHASAEEVHQLLAAVVG